MSEKLTKRSMLTKKEESLSPTESDRPLSFHRSMITCSGRQSNLQLQVMEKVNARMLENISER